MRAATGPFNPCILVGRNRPVGHSQRLHTGDPTSWMALALSKGQWQEPDRNRSGHGPAALLLPPGPPRILACQRGSYLHEICFDLAWTGERQLSGRKLEHPADAPAQPRAAELFNRELPEVIPEPLADSTVATIIAIEDLWWRGSMGRLQANQRLHAWFVELLLHLDRGPAVATALPPEEAILSRWEDLARQQMPTGATVADLVHQVGISRSHFDTLFKQHRGRTPASWLREQRLLRAIDMLDRSDRPIGQIAERVGYRDADAFTKQFKRRYGCGPQQWRQRHGTGG